jgi:hypothetical protein
MQTKSIVEQPMPVPNTQDQPYPPSWVDRLQNWVDRLPLPPWGFYLCLWFFLILIESGSKWIDGMDPYLKIRWIYIFYSFYGAYFLAAIHYLDRWAKSAYPAFSQTLSAGEGERSPLVYRLATMPAGTVWWITAVTPVSVIALFRPLVVPLWQAMGFFHSSVTAELVDLVLFAFNALVVVIFVFHTLRQLKWISRIHETASRINLFHLRPLYSLSGLTARTAGILLIVGFVIGQQTGSHGGFTEDPYALGVSELFTVASIVIYSSLAMAVFFLPLLGLHQRLLKEKERLQGEADSRLQAHIQELHRRIDAGQLKDADAINYHLTSLALERDILARLPTWPWQPGTFNLVLTAVLLPVVLWFAQRILERWAGF